MLVFVLLVFKASYDSAHTVCACCLKHASKPKYISKVQTHYVQPNFSNDLTFFAADFKKMLKIGSLITLFQVELNCLNNFTYMKEDIRMYCP